MRVADPLPGHNSHSLMVWEAISDLWGRTWREVFSGIDSDAVIRRNLPSPDP